MASIWDRFFGSEETKTEVRKQPPRRLPEYPEAEEARKLWGQKIGTWGEDPSYGAISPMWEDIWGLAKKRVSQYYGGGPGGQPGARDRARSRRAQRGVSESPASMFEEGNLDRQESSMLADISTRQAIEEATFGERARQNWLSSTSQLAGQKPAYWFPGQTTTSSTTGGEGWDIIGGLGSLGVQYMGNQQMAGALSQMGQGGGGGGGQGGGGGFGMPDDFNDWFNLVMGGGRMAMGDYSGALQAGSAFYDQPAYGAADPNKRKNPTIKSDNPYGF